MYWEKRTLFFSVIILIISFVLIYFVYFNQTTWKKALESLWWGLSSWENYLNNSDISNTWYVDNDITNSLLKEDIDISKEDHFLIDWVSLYDWSFDLLESLWLSSNKVYSYSWNYLSLVTWDLNQLSSIVNKIWWNTVEITNKKIILDNQLVGDKVFFVNLPEYKNQKVILLIEFKKDNNIWFLSFNTKDYYKSKSFLKSFFKSYDE